MNILRLTTITLSLILLVACGGGGGGGGAGGVGGGGAGGITPPPPPALEDLPGLLIENPEQARSRIAGSSPPNVTGDIKTGLVEEAGVADILLFSDLVNVSVSPAGTIDVTCIDRVCTTENVSSDPSSGRFEFSLDSFGAVPQVAEQNLIGFNEEYSAVMNDEGVRLVQEIAAGRTVNNGVTREFQSYGGWLDNSVFAIQIERATNDEGNTITLLASYSFGEVNDEQNSRNPTSAPLIWNGVMVGVTKDADPNVIQGEAMIGIDDLASPSVDIEFTDVVNLFDPTSNVDDMNWTWTDLTLTEGAFEHTDGSIEGMFYGTTHDEVGGVFDRHEIVGAFGATRRTQ